ncbi:TauD/TfdA dioxygenase family protein [Pseudofrankia inefficax]|uniref:Taurine catabolism dioxygenase TauD/TfdA n=1 Tax=Pseudofrankia inefficax (strain DSM 45817 / CECT 9037 / DDB 130130 / EuI1c) TaxID=298654 RepID=E3IZ59_PSEI1|nr:TauD/TfdA family dioxygenase [Pseudofrankia inefficax]ADP81486.1 Taurine catabolism dioxygenase TauD/TfdA [Pseudofrankia inefficax]
MLNQIHSPGKLVRVPVGRTPVSALGVAPSWKPLSDRFGVEVRGLNLANVTDEDSSSLRGLLLRHGVVAVPDQILDPDQHIALAARFGRVTPSSAVIPGLNRAYPQIKVIDSRRWDGGLDAWHSVMQYMPEPAAVLVLYLRVAPPGGTTLRWLSRESAYDALDPDLKARLRGVRGVHHAPALDEYLRAFGPGRWNGRTITRVDPVEHPVVRVHPETGRLGLFIDPWSTQALVGVPAAQGRRLLERLVDHLTSPEHEASYPAEPGTVVLVDMRSTLMRATDAPGPRILHRVGVYDVRPAEPVDDRW